MNRIFATRLRSILRFQKVSRFDFKCLASQEHKQDDKTNHFGFHKVTDKEKSEKVYNVFAGVASNYDVMNDLMSFGIHRYWKKEFMKRLDPGFNTKLLDVAGGTGDVAFEFLNYTKQLGDDQSCVTVCDINEKMIDVGKKRARELRMPSDRIDWVVGDAEALPFDDETFDAYTISFGIRNVVHIDKALEEAHRVLKPGGIFMCLEFSSQVNNPLLKSLYDWYSFSMIPLIGEIVAKDSKSYQYLAESIRKFPDQENLKRMIEDANFTLVEYDNFLSGIASIHLGFKQYNK